jgi:hypothetical protein
MDEKRIIGRKGAEEKALANFPPAPPPHPHPPKRKTRFTFSQQKEALGLPEEYYHVCSYFL